MNKEIEGALPPPLTIPSDSQAKQQFWQEEVKRWKASGKKQSVYVWTDFGIGFCIMVNYLSIFLRH